eukprot:4244277-Pyramimonas_sp.AAC.2
MLIPTRSMDIKLVTELRFDIAYPVVSRAARPITLPIPRHPKSIPAHFLVEGNPQHGTLGRASTTLLPAQAWPA